MGAALLAVLGNGLVILGVSSFRPGDSDRRGHHRRDRGERPDHSPEVAGIVRSVTAPSIVQLDSLTKSYNGIRALDNVSLTLRPGPIHGLVGHNGAGKSTLVKILSGDSTRLGSDRDRRRGAHARQS